MRIMQIYFIEIGILMPWALTPSVFSLKIWPIYSIALVLWNDPFFIFYLFFLKLTFSYAEITSDFVDIASSTYGAIINRDDCRKFVVCTTCNAITHLFPSTKLAMVLTDHVIPSTYKSDMYFVAKQAFINDMQQNCHEVYECPIQSNDENWYFFVAKRIDLIFPSHFSPPS